MNSFHRVSQERMMHEGMGKYAMLGSTNLKEMGFKADIENNTAFKVGGGGCQEGGRVQVLVVVVRKKRILWRGAYVPGGREG